MKRIRQLLAILLCLSLVIAPADFTFADDEAMPIAADEAAPDFTEESDPDTADESSVPPEPPADPAPSDEETEQGEPDVNELPSTPDEDELAPGGDGATNLPAKEVPDGSAGEPDENPNGGEGEPLPDAEPDAPEANAPDANVDPNAIDYTQSAAVSPAFNLGYAELRPDTAAYAAAGIDAALLGTIGGGVVYVLGRETSDRADRLNVAFDWEGVRYAWVDASQARPMTPEDVTAFVLACAAREDVRTMPDSPELPLDKLKCVPADASGGVAAPQAVYEPIDLPAEIRVPDAKLVVPQDSLALGVGETRAIGASFSDGESYGIQYSVEGEDFVSVSQDGVITALAQGDATVKLHCDFDDAQVHVTVKAAPTGVTLSAPRTVLAAGEQVALEAALPEGEEFELTYSTSNPAVALPNERGVVTTIAPGTAVITAKTYNNLSASVTLTVLPALQDIALNATELTLGVKQTYQLRATLTPANAANFYSFSVTETEPEGVVQVDPQTGLIEALTPGTATVTVEAYNQKKASCKVTVNRAPEKIAFEEEAIEIGLKEIVTVPFKVIAPEGVECTSSYTYSTSDSTVAAVNPTTGAIKGVKAGKTATITVTAHNGVEAHLQVTVRKAPTKVTLSAQSQVLGVDDTVQLKATANTGTASHAFTFSSNNTAKVAVDGTTGLVTAVAPGWATITAKAFNGAKATIKITVMAAPDGVALTLPDDGTIGVDQTCKLTATTLPAGTAGTCTFHVAEGDRGVLEVDEVTGAIAAHAAGTAEVWVSTYNGKTSEHATITVLDAPETLTLAESSIAIGLGETSPVPAIAIPEGSKAILTYATSNKKIVTVDGSGKLFGRAVGSAIITVTAQNGASATLTVAVKKKPTKVTLAASTARRTLGVDETVTLTAVPSTGSVSYINAFASSNSNVLKVIDDNLYDTTCEIRAVGEGKASITVTTYNKKKYTLTFTVLKKPDSIALSFPEADNQIGVGQKLSMKATLPAGTAGSYSFSSNAEETLAVDPETGALTAKQPGRATITVETYNHVKASLEIEVVPAPDSIAFAEPSISIGLGETSPVPAVSCSRTDGKPSKAILTYATSNKKIVTVDGSGKLFGKAMGSAIITVTAQNGASATLTVAVKKKPTKVTLAASTARRTLGVGETVTLTAVPSTGSVSYINAFASSNSNVLKVIDDNLYDTTCEIRAAAEGKASITVTTYNKKKYTLTFTVLKKPDSIALSFPEADNQIGVGQKLSMKATLPAGTAGSYSFSSNAEDILAVDPDTGALTAKQPGKATITVETYNHVKASLEIEVVPAPDSIAFAEPSISIGLGETAPMPAVTIPEGSKATLTYTPSNKKIVTIDGSGKLCGKAVGSATVTVTAQNNPEATATLTVAVKKKPTKVTLAASTARRTLGMGETVTLTAVPSTGSVSYINTFTSSNSGVLELINENPNDATCEFRAAGEGSTSITVLTYNNMKYTLTFTVLKAPDDITLTFPDADNQIGVGQKLSVTATLPVGTAGYYSFSSNAEETLAVDPDTGALTAKQPGKATITVETYNHVKASLEIEVVPAPDSIAFAEPSIVIGLGETAYVPEVTYSRTDGQPCKAALIYGTSNKKYVTVDGSGNLCGKAVGSATITVAAQNNTKATATLAVTVGKAPTKVTISAHHTELGVGERLTLTAVPSTGTVSYVNTFTSSNPGVLEVIDDNPNDTTCEIRAAGAGSASITVTTYNKKKYTLAFTVLKHPDEVLMQTPELTLGKGETYTVRSTTLPEGSGGGRTYSIEPEGSSIARIDPTTGVLQALAVGDVTVRVTMYDDGQSAPATNALHLTVKNAPTDIVLNNGHPVELSLGDGFQIPRPTLLGEDVYWETFSYTSTKPEYVTVDSTGWVYAKKADNKSKSNITVGTYSGGPSKVFTVVVRPAPKSISFSASKYRLFMNRKFIPAVSFDNNVPSSYTLTSSDPAIAKVAEDGKTIEAVSPGTITLTAKSYNGKTATTQVWVPELPDRVWLEPAELTLGEGDSAKMAVGWPEGTGAEMTYESEKPGVAAVEVVDNDNIIVSAVEMGNTRIHAHSQNGLDCYATVAVKKAPTALSISPRNAVRSIDEKSLQLRWDYGSADEGGSTTFTSSDATVATVDANGLVTFLKVGTVRITARTYNGHEAVCDLRIGEKPGKMFFEQESYKVALHDRVRILASFDKGCVGYTLQADEGGIVEVVDGDVVHALEKGTATLTATSNLYDLTAECTVEVVDEPTGIEADITDDIWLTVGISSTKQLHAIPLLNGKPSVGSVYYATDDPAVAVVDYDTGLVTPKGKGTTTIRAFTYNGHETTYTVHVKYLLEGVTVGVDPGHQANADLSKESSSPSGGSSKYKVSAGTRGCVTGIAEHATVLKIGLKLRDQLEKLGATVVMTRETANVNISNQQRAAKMNDAHVDIALRLHCDSADTSSAHGLGIFIRGSSAYSDKTLKSYAEKNNTAKSKTNSSAANLLGNEWTAADKIYNQIYKATGCGLRGIRKNNDYTMNNWCKMPCLLIEMGFMSNATDDRNLNNDKYQDKLVKGMVKGVCEYMGLSVPTEW